MNLVVTRWSNLCIVLQILIPFSCSIFILTYCLDSFQPLRYLISVLYLLLSLSLWCSSRLLCESLNSFIMIGCSFGCRANWCLILCLLLVIHQFARPAHFLIWCQPFDHSSQSLNRYNCIQTLLHSVRQIIDFNFYLLIFKCWVKKLSYGCWIFQFNLLISRKSKTIVRWEGPISLFFAFSRRLFLSFCMECLLTFVPGWSGSAGWPRPNDVLQ